MPQGFVDVIPERWFDVVTDHKESFEKIAEMMFQSVQTNFIEGGRPPWEALARGGVSHLHESGALYGSIQKFSGEDFAEIQAGQGIPYAAIHQFGGTINHPGSDKPQVFTVNGALVFAAKGTKPHQIRIPARPYLSFQDEDIEAIKAMLPNMFLRFYNVTTEGREN